MEADWEVELGGESPLIDACWEGFVDLRRTPELVGQLPELLQLPALACALTKLNSAASPVWTSKCDVWTPEEFDPDELDAPRETGKCALACYIDLLPRNGQLWLLPEDAIAECRAICAQLRAVPMHCCRVDLIVRRACTVLDRNGVGITAYLTACGPGLDSAHAALASALRGFVDAVGGSMVS